MAAAVAAPVPAESTPVVTGAAVGSSTDQSALIELLKQQHAELLTEQRHTNELLVAANAEASAERQRGDSWKRNSRSYHTASNVSSPRHRHRKKEGSFFQEQQPRVLESLLTTTNLTCV